MPDEMPPSEPLANGVQSSLHVIAEILRDAKPMGRDVRSVLAELVEELAQFLAMPSPPPSEVAHLAESTANLTRAVHRGAAPGVLATARDRVEVALLAVETKAPLLAGLARRLLDTLGNLGI